jgi:hypothetical protein
MSHNIIAHLAGEEPIEGEIDELPAPTATFIAIKNPHKRGNQELEWLDRRTITLLVSLTHLVSVEIAAPHDSEDLVLKYYGNSSSSSTR